MIPKRLPHGIVNEQAICASLKFAEPYLRPLHALTLVSHSALERVPFQQNRTSHAGTAANRVTYSKALRHQERQAPCQLTRFKGTARPVIMNSALTGAGSLPQAQTLRYLILPP